MMRALIYDDFWVEGKREYDGSAFRVSFNFPNIPADSPVKDRLPFTARIALENKEILLTFSHIADVRTEAIYEARKVEMGDDPSLAQSDAVLLCSRRLLVKI